jgi:hypothetical protein
MLNYLGGDFLAGLGLRRIVLADEGDTPTEIAGVPILPWRDVGRAAECAAPLALKPDHPRSLWVGTICNI